MNWSLISAVNNEAVLNSCLLGSPAVRTATDVILQRGFLSAASAYNAGIERATTDILVFAHQDTYLPEAWTHDVQNAIERLSQTDRDWGVLGVWGVAKTGNRAGHLYCAGLMETLGGPFEGGREVRTLDEVLLIIRKSSGLRFDSRMPGFHMYASDVCLEAEAQNRRCYAISAFCIHNTNGYNLLPVEFWRSYLFMRRKWRFRLPVITPCTEITATCWPMIRWNVKTVANLGMGRHRAGTRVDDPQRLYADLTSGALVSLNE